MKKILLIANFVSFPWEMGNCRFMYILNLLSEKNHDIELITTNFNHLKKAKRMIDDNQINSLPFKVTLIDEPGYQKNVSINRLYSHRKLGSNLKKYLATLKCLPDIIYCSVPSLDMAKVAAEFAKKNNIRFIIDIQDLWPEAFKMVFHIPLLSNLIFYPMKKKADYIYSIAEDIVAVSETYLNRAVSVNKIAKNKLSVFLGTDLDYFDRLKNKEYDDNKNLDNSIKVVYIGTLGYSYDLKCVIDALAILKKQGMENIKFIVMGKGPLQDEFEKYAKEKMINCEFTGNLDYEKMVGYLCNCDIAVNPIKTQSAASIINKVGDYAMAGLPVINTQESEEYRNLVEKYQIGFNCENGNAIDVAEKIKLLYSDKNLRERLGKNNRKLAEEKFDRKKTYKKIIKLITEN